MICPNCGTTYPDTRCPQCEWLWEQLLERLREERVEVATLAEIVSRITYERVPRWKPAWRVG